MSKTERGIALVTGASSGIGLVTAQALRRDGYRVFGTSRKPMPDIEDGISMLVCDVTDDASVRRAVDEVLSRAGRIDLLVNNAGIGLLGGAEESTTEQAKAVFDVNVFGVMRMTNAVLPVMRRQRRGRIVNLSSILGLIPAPIMRSTPRPNTPSKVIRNPLITKCGRRASASCLSSLALPAPPLKRTSRGLTGHLRFTIPFARTPRN